MNKGKLIYETNEERGYVARAWDLPDSKGDAFIQISKGDSVVREFLFPAYKVWNIAAHLPDIVDSEFLWQRCPQKAVERRSTSYNRQSSAICKAKRHTFAEPLV